MSLCFLMNYLRMNAIILMRRHMLEILILEFPLKKKKFDLNIFTFAEPINDISHENIIQEPPIDLLFKNLFEEELMCLDEPTRDILVNYTPLGESADLSFEEMYGTELEFLGIHGKEVSTEKCDDDQFLNNGCRNMRKKSLKKVRLGRKRAKMTKKLASPRCPIRGPIGMMGRELEE